MARQDRFPMTADPAPMAAGGRLAEPVTAAAGALVAAGPPGEPMARADGLLAAFRQLSGGDSLQGAGAAVLTQGCTALTADEGVLLLAGDAGALGGAHPHGLPALAAPAALEVTWLDTRHATGEGLRPVAHIGAAGVQGRLGTRPADQARAAGTVSARQAVVHDNLPGGSEVWCP